MRTRDVVVVGLLLAGLLAGIVILVVDGVTAGGAPADTTSAPATLPLDDVSLSAIEEWSGLDLPPGADDFLSARAGEGQLDVTFTMPESEEDDFLTASGLPEPREGERYVLHSSPLWKLNPGADDGTDRGDTGDSAGSDPFGAPDPAETPRPTAEIRGALDVRGNIGRVVELLEEAPGTVRARVVLTALG